MAYKRNSKTKYYLSNKHERIDSFRILIYLIVKLLNLLLTNKFKINKVRIILNNLILRYIVI